jgi:hypothetical protein
MLGDLKFSFNLISSLFSRYSFVALKMEIMNDKSERRMKFSYKSFQKSISPSADSNLKVVGKAEADIFRSL